MSTLGRRDVTAQDSALSQLRGENATSHSACVVFASAQCGTDDRGAAATVADTTCLLCHRIPLSNSFFVASMGSHFLNSLCCSIDHYGMTSMRCFNPSNRSLSPTRQTISVILTDAQNLYAEVQQAFNNGRDVGNIYANSVNLLIDLQERMRTKSGDAPNVLRNRFSRIQDEFNELINPISHSIKNDQSTRRARQER